MVPGEKPLGASSPGVDPGPHMVGGERSLHCETP